MDKLLLESYLIVPTFSSDLVCGLLLCHQLGHLMRVLQVIILNAEFEYVIYRVYSEMLACT